MKTATFLIHEPRIKIPLKHRIYSEISIQSIVNMEANIYPLNRRSTVQLDVLQIMHVRCAPCSSTNSYTELGDGIRLFITYTTRYCGMIQPSLHLSLIFK